MALLSTSDNFTRSYNKRGLQPFHGDRGAQPMQKSNPSGVRNVEVKGRIKGSTRQIAGNTARATGVAMQAVGKVTKTAGRASTRAGASLSSTGVGAIVGVPLMAMGGVATGVGKGVDIAGKQVGRAGRRFTKKNNKALAARGLIKDLSIHARAVMTGFFYALPIAVCWFLEVGSFILAAGVDAALDTEIEQEDGLIVQLWKVVSAGAQGAFGLISDALSGLTGGAIDLAAIVGSLHPANFFALFYIATVGFCIMTMLSVWFVYEIGGAKPLSGEGEGAKRAAFLLMLCLYCLPFVHLFPWFLLWSTAIKLNDK